MAENCTYVESLGTQICTYHLQGNNQIVGTEQKMFVMDEDAQMECGITSTTSNGGNSEEIAVLQREIELLQSQIDNAGAIFEENSPIYNSYLNAVNFVNSLVDPYFSFYNWAESTLQNLVDDYSNNLVDEEYYDYWFNHYTITINNIVTTITDTLYAYDYPFLVSQRDYYYDILSTNLVYVSGGQIFQQGHPLYNQPSNYELITQLQSQIDGLESQNPPENVNVDMQCVAQYAETPITLYNPRGISEGMILQMRIRYNQKDYLVEFRVDEVSPAIVTVMGRDENFSVLYGTFNNFPNMYAALLSQEPSLQNLTYKELESENITITLLQ